ncbi:MAG: hypothetical protein MRY21_06585 [Simkaniaceae bacterium]|nr:hypothetical protein [Simkaniaceae bacterium]
MKQIKDASIEELAAIVSEQLRKYKIDATLVGGGCVTIYSQNKYLSYDLDFVTFDDLKIISEALEKIGFIKKEKYFSHPDSKFFVEFLNPPVAIGNEPIKKFSAHSTPLGIIKMLTPTDSLKDRLSGFYHWEDRQSLEQAIILFKDQKGNIDLDEVKRWSIKENHEKKFNQFYQAIHN